MDDEEFVRLIELVEGLMGEFGLSDIAAESNFVELAVGEEPPRLMEPPRRLISLLEAFDVHLMLNDRSVVRRSLARISETCDGPGPETATLVRPFDRDATPTEDLLELPDLSQLREELGKLILLLRETPRGGVGDEQ